MGATYIECSAKESRGVDQVFDLAIDTAVAAENKSKVEPGAANAGGGKKIKKRTCKIL